MFVEGPAGRKSPSSPAPSPLRRAPPVAGSSSSRSEKVRSGRAAAALSAPAPAPPQPRPRPSPIGHRPARRPRPRAPPGPQAPPPGPALRPKHPAVLSGPAPVHRIPAHHSLGPALRSARCLRAGVTRPAPHPTPPSSHSLLSARGLGTPSSGVLEPGFQTPPRRARLPAAGPRQNGGVAWDSPWAFRYLSSASCEPASALWVSMCLGFFL